ncbi:MAG: hypothetical protein BGO61_05605 [Thiobacillus sp. 65-69]|nr:rhodanese-like domain-containing protein [Thiobacillus sp.]ODU86958.1 MAG: hypothetical protein ABT21_14145 [Thiobacillus sp. SCN 65-179]OJW36748.1 MAG: hypothetical protein BGO61_05605 [Thiobacillus sp. 65-69]
MKKALPILSLALASALSLNAQAFDTEMAAKIAPVAGQLTQANLAKGGCKVSAEDALKMMTEDKEKVTVLDVRTHAEAKVVAMPKALHIPMDQLFKKENLDRLPTDGKILVMCHSGNRAAGSTALLNSVGFRNAVYVNGGLIALITATTPKNVPLE